jgi:predicted phosphodiesterase
MRYGLVTDIHSNLAALEATLKSIEQKGPIDGLLCMGDIIGYGPQPNEVIKRLKEYPLFSIIGNHDMAVIGQLELADFNHDAIDANVWTRVQLEPENLEWLESLSPKAVFDEKVTLAHGSPLEPVWEYLTTPHAATRNFNAFDTQLCLVGHTHLPRLFFLRESEINRIFGFSTLKADMHIPEDNETIELGDNRAIINPGSVGQPRDGNPQAAFAIYDDEEMTVSFYRVSYDIIATQELMHQAHLPLSLSIRLDYGR